MVDYQEIYDISLVLGEQCPAYPGDEPFTISSVAGINSGSPYNLSRLRMSPHWGTHIDAPAHFIDGGNTIDLYPVENFILPAVVIETDDKIINMKALEGLEISPRQAVLFKTRNSMDGKIYSPGFDTDFVHMNFQAAQHLVSRKPALVGIDYLSIEEHDSQTYPIHRLFLANEILILESLNLSQVPPGEYTLICLPLKIKACEASPVRAVLIR